MNIKKYLFTQDEYGTDSPTTLGKFVCGTLMAVTFCVAALIVSRLVSFLMVVFA